AASYRVYEGLMYAPSALATVLTPRFSQLFVDDRKALRSMFRRSLFGSAAMAILVGGAAVLLARPMIRLFYGSAYGPAVPPLQVLAGGSIFVFCTWILHSAAIAINLDRRLVATTAVGLVTNIGLNIAFIPRWGITGAAWATVIAEAVTVTLLFAQVHRRLATAGSPA
ncbi:MAG TPA: polysaccharide biosynthesis C-terminal domain-containing protein, partial [Vicinamibacterales bacterium]|nr:polysaccharide biosynthesis C-terminal domain-containing protein [Vicinamibacterales bacterium]